MDRIFISLIQKLTPGVILTLSWGCIRVYDHYSQTSLLVYNADLGEHLQDHRSSSFISNRCFHTHVVHRALTSCIIYYRGSTVQQRVFVCNRTDHGRYCERLVPLCKRS